MIIHQKCDLFESGADIIAHQTNCRGVMGSGVARQVRDKFPEVYQEYVREYARCDKPSQLLGQVQFLETKHNGKRVIIANMFAQDRYGYDGKRYTDYEAFRKCLIILHDYAFDPGSIRPQAKPLQIAMPWRIGCVRGGGDWDSVIYPMIGEILHDTDVILCERDE